MKTVLVTGATEGIGKSIAKIFAENKYRVILNGLDDAFMDEAINELKEYEVLALKKNMLDDDFIEKLSILLDENKLKIDILVCNAAIQIEEPFQDISYNSFYDTYLVNIYRNLELLQMVIPNQNMKKWGRNIFIGSIHQTRPIYDMLTYASSKAALENIMKNLTYQYATDNLTFNCVSPGFVTTRRNLNKLDNLQEFVNTIPSRSTTTPDEVANVVYNLALDNSKYINGAVIPIDGGASI